MAADQDNQAAEVASDAPPSPPSGRTEAAPLKRKVAGGSPLKPFLVLGAVAVLALTILGVSWLRTPAKEPATRAATNTVSTPDNVGFGATEPVSPQYADLVAEENARAVQEAEGAGIGAVVVPPIIGSPIQQQPAEVAAPIEQGPVAYEPIQYAPPSQVNNLAREEAARRYVAAASEIRQQWTSATTQAVTKGVAPARSEAPAPAPEDSGPPPPSVPLLAVMNAVVEVGANSDAPAEVIVRITSGPLAGAKALGRVVTTGQAQDTLQLRFERFLLPSGALYSGQALAVDPATRIPTVAGKVNRHFVRNFLSRAGVAFLVGYAGGLTSGSTSLDVGTGLISSGLSRRELLQAEAANQAADSLADMGGRQPTVKLAYGSPVGIVLLEPLSSPRSTALVQPQTTPSETNPIAAATAAQTYRPSTPLQLPPAEIQ